MHLHVSPDAPLIVRAAAEALLFGHIGGASLGLVSGAIAMVVRKGGRLHRWAGNVFFVSLLTMAAIGAGAAPFLPPWRDNVFMGTFTCYLVATGWATARRRNGGVGRVEIGALCLAAAGAAAAVMAVLPGTFLPPGKFDTPSYNGAFFFVAAWPLCAASDLSVILRQGVSGAQRIARHLWRMSLAMLIATISLFLGQQQLFPASLRGTPVLVLPILAVLGLMIFWLLRTLFSSAFRPTSGAGKASSAGEPSTAHPSHPGSRSPLGIAS